MLSIPASRPNAYTGSPLDRAANRREDTEFIAEALASPETLFVPVWRARSLMKGVQEGRPEAVLLTGAAAEAVRMAGGPWTFLGLWNGRPVFAVDCSAAEDPLPLLPGDMGGFTDLRAVAGLLPEGEASVRGDHCLLGHSTRFPTTVMYSTLAGFLEPGESLEEAVRREVFEEAGVHVGAVAYHSSQPWPFPSSIMLGFHAEALTDTITIDREELRDARWFSRAEIREPEAHGFALPRRDSIARRLIEDWLHHGVAAPGAELPRAEPA